MINKKNLNIRNVEIEVINFIKEYANKNGFTMARAVKELLHKGSAATNTQDNPKSTNGDN